MLKSAHGINVKAWKDIKLDFVPGINMLTGHSRAGKTILFRGIKWLNENRPNNTSMLSHWVKKTSKKGTESIIDFTSFKLECDDGTVERGRGPGGPKDNVYITNGKRLEAVKTDVPEDAKNLINMSEVNFGAQHGECFLLRSEGKGGAEAARFLNNLVDFTAGDLALQKAQSLTTEARQTEKRYKENLKEATENLQRFDELELLQELVEDAEDLEETIVDIRKDISDLLGYKDNINNLQQQLDSLPDADKLEQLIKELEEKAEGEKATREKINDLTTYKDTLVKCSTILEDTRDLDRAQEASEQAAALTPEIVKLENSLKDLNFHMISFKKCKAFMEQTGDLEKASEKLREAESLSRGIEIHQSQLSGLIQLKNDFIKQEKALSNCIDVGKVSELIIDIEDLSRDIIEAQDDIKELKIISSTLKVKHQILGELDISIKKVEEEMGDICPNCNGTGRAKR